MNVDLVDVYGYRGAHTILYLLLQERDSSQSISHKEMPSWTRHCEFVDSQPYHDWWLIVVGHEPVGAIYFTHQREIGIGIFRVHRKLGYAKAAIKQVMAKYSPPFYANINPQNGASLTMFDRLGFNLIQHTYSYE